MIRESLSKRTKAYIHTYIHTVKDFFNEVSYDHTRYFTINGISNKLCMKLRPYNLHKI